MWQELKKIWCDVMLNPANGRYSIKRLTTASCMVLFWIGFFASIVEMHLWPDQSFKVLKPEIELMLACLGGALGSSWLTIKGHLNSRKTKDETGNDLAPAYTETPKEE